MFVKKVSRYVDCKEVVILHTKILSAKVYIFYLLLDFLDMFFLTPPYFSELSHSLLFWASYNFFSSMDSVFCRLVIILSLVLLLEFLMFSLFEEEMYNCIR